jgi:hypothetical protein
MLPGARKTGQTLFSSQLEGQKGVPVGNPLAKE